VAAARRRWAIAAPAPLAEVKIDRSFVLGAATDEADAAVVRAIVGLAGDLGLRTVADGVEDERTWRALARTGLPDAGLVLRPADARRAAGQLDGAVPRPVAAAAHVTRIRAFPAGQIDSPGCAALGDDYAEDPPDPPRPDLP
jgi:predicted signal transduction protein with EAL and GGDEF domain